MGVFAGVTNADDVNVAAIAETMRPSLYGWFSAHIRIVDPATSTTTPYDPTTDIGGVSVPSVVWDSGPAGALIQPLRAPTEIQFTSQANHLMQFSIQTKIDYAEVVPFRSGLQVWVVDGGNDPTLETVLFEIGRGVDSSMTWGRILHVAAILGGMPPSALPEETP